MNTQATPAPPFYRANLSAYDPECDAPLQAGENEVIAGGVDSPFVFSVYLG
jgi:hypothetical protein